MESSVPGIYNSRGKNCQFQILKYHGNYFDSTNRYVTLLVRFSSSMYNVNSIENDICLSFLKKTFHMMAYSQNLVKTINNCKEIFFGSALSITVIFLENEICVKILNETFCVFTLHECLWERHKSICFLPPPQL